MRRSIVWAAMTVLGLLAGCGKGTPTAPAGSTLTISANPATISLLGVSTITVVGRKPDGNPMVSGTEIRLSTNLGTINTLVTTDSNGIATALLHGDGRPGSAAVKATYGDGTVTAEVDVQIGQSSGAKPTLLISVNPDNVPVRGTATITVLARNADGSSVGSGQTVILTTTLGTVSPDRPRTHNDGTATSTLNAGNFAGQATVTAVLGTSDPATAQVTIRDGAADISVQANPSTVPAQGGTLALSAFVTNAEGQALQGAPVTFQSERGTLSTTGVTFTDTTGLASNTLTLTQQQLTGVTSFTITASTPDPTGHLLTSTATITVQ